MPVEEPHTIELWMAGITATGATIWKALNMFFKLRSDVDAACVRLNALEDETRTTFESIKTDIKELSERTEVRHDRIDDKLDRIIERR